MSDKAEFLSTVRAAVRRYKSATTGSDADIDPADKQLFDSMEQAEALLELLAQASAQPMTGDNLIMAGDLLNWPGAENWFQRARANIGYKRDI
jgi:hypothetical protein